jgi:hypothetical protein
MERTTVGRTEAAPCDGPRSVAAEAPPALSSWTTAIPATPNNENRTYLASLVMTFPPKAHC